MLGRNDQPQFCIITPIEYLGAYASQSNMHLVLAHLVDQSEEYADFYHNCDEFKIMDNGAFELGESYPPEDLVRLGEKCRANAIVLPDYPFQHEQKTIQAAVDLIPSVREAGFHTVFCPQSKVGDWEGWVDAYEWGAANPRIDILGMSILAIPNALPHIPPAYARVVATEVLYRQGIFAYDKYHHYLGLNAGPALEIPPLLEMGALDSCDSSNPVWAGICGQMYTKGADSYLPIRKIGKHVDFHYHMVDDPFVHDAIQNNIDLTLDLFDRS